MGKKIDLLEEESTNKPKEKPKPPPVPPRKILKKKSNKQQAPQPPEAEHYVNACEDTTLANGKHEYESDDTASTISTVIDKLSLSSSNFSSEIDLTQSNSETELSKVLKPFILLEKEFNIESSIEIPQILKKPSPSPLRRDYENVELKKKDVDYENVELRPKVLVGGETLTPVPTPKPRNSVDCKSATLEPKKRTAIPTPRKSNSFKEEKETPTKKAVSETKSLPTNIVTKIPKAINLVFNRSPMSRSKTETDMKSKIPVVKKIELEKPKKTLEKQKSETDLRKSNLPTAKQIKSPPTKLVLHRSNSSEISNLPTFKQVKSPPTKLVLHRSNSTEIRYNFSERSVDEPKTVVEEKTKPTEEPKPQPPTPKARGPKPKPPERVDSLKKIEKPNVIQIKDIAEISPLPQEPQKLLQTFKVQPQTVEVQKEIPTEVQLKTEVQPQPKSQPQSPSSPQNKEIKFKIQTYETSMAERESTDKKTIFTFTDVNGNNSENSFYILPEEQKKTHTFYLNPKPAVNAVTNHKTVITNDEVHECPIVVGKCVKVMDGNSTYYSSSSEEEDEVEEGEKLGPPELVNGPGPSEAYFNMFWHANLLPTIGEVEEEMSSLEPG